MTKVTVKWDGDKISRNVAKAAERGALKTAESILRESNQMVPYDTGELKNSGKIVGDGGEVAVAYFASYAGDVHESPKAFRNGKQNKFLESSMNNHAGKLTSTVKDEVQKELR